MADISIGSMDTEAVDSLEAKAPVRLAQPKHGLYQRPGIISNLFKRTGSVFSRSPDPKLGLVCWRFLPSAAASLFFRLDWASLFLLFVC